MEQKAGDLHKFTRSFIRVACNYLTTQLEELGTIVSPSEYLRDFINTLGNSAKITTEVTIGEQPSHTDFWSSDIVGNRELLENIKHLTKVFFDEIEERSGQSEFFYALEMQCWSSIVTKLTQRECSTAETAALMQFSITGPIIRFLSDLGGYKIKREEKGVGLYIEEETEPEAKTPRGYALWTLRRESWSGDVVAVIVEAKLHRNSHIAVAQAIGYYIAFTAPDPARAMPLVFVLTEEVIHLVLFPFKNEEKSSLVNALAIQFPLWTEDEGSSNEFKLPRLLNLQLLHILASLELAQKLDVFLNIEYTYSDATTKLHLTNRIISESEHLKQRKEELYVELKRKDAELKRKDAELKRELKRKDAELKRELEEKDAELMRLQKALLEEQDAEIKRLKEALQVQERQRQ